MTKNKNSKMLFLLFLFIHNLAFAQTYLSYDQIKKSLYNNNLNRLKSHEYALESKQLEQMQSDLMTTPKVFTEIEKTDDRAPKLIPESNGQRNYGDSEKLGVQDQMKFGLKWRAYVIHDHQAANDVTTLTQSSADVSLHRTGAGIDLEIPLLKSGDNGHIALQKKVLSESSKVVEFEAKAKNQGEKIEILNLYIEAAKTAQSIQNQIELVTQGQRLVDWSQKQEAERLLEASQVYAAKSTLVERQLVLETKRMIQDTNLRNLFTKLNQKFDSNTQFDNLGDILKNTKAPEINTTDNFEIKAKQHALEAQKAQINSEILNLKPDLDLKAQYIIFNKTSATNDTARCKNPTSCSYSSINLTFSMPLDFSLFTDGINKSKYRIKSKEIELSNEKLNIYNQLDIQKKQIKSFEIQESLIQDLIIQLSKRIEQELIRQKKGKATTFDVIQSQQELIQAKERLIETQAQHLQVIHGLYIFQENV